VLTARDDEWRGQHASKTKSIDWPARARNYERALTPQLRAELAEALGVPERALVLLGVGWEAYTGRWTFPEADGAGRVVGISCRDRQGRKKAMSESGRGLTVPRDWRDLAGAVLLVEGPSDTPRLHSRPSSPAAAAEGA
jgi:hypothetical protein